MFYSKIIKYKYKIAEVTALEMGYPKGTSPARYGQPIRSLKLGGLVCHLWSYVEM